MRFYLTNEEELGMYEAYARTLKKTLGLREKEISDEKLIYLVEKHEDAVDHYEYTLKYEKENKERQEKAKSDIYIIRDIIRNVTDAIMYEDVIAYVWALAKVKNLKEKVRKEKEENEG